MDHQCKKKLTLVLPTPFSIQNNLDFCKVNQESSSCVGGSASSTCTTSSWLACLLALSPMSFKFPKQCCIWLEALTPPVPQRYIDDVTVDFFYTSWRPHWVASDTLGDKACRPREYCTCWGNRPAHQGSAVSDWGLWNILCRKGLMMDSPYFLYIVKTTVGESDTTI